MSAVKPVVRSGAALAALMALLVVGGTGRGDITVHDMAASKETPSAEWDQTSKESLPEKLSGPRDALQGYGIDQSHFDRLTDGVSWQESENELLLRIMFRLRDFRVMDLEAWAHTLSKASDLAEKTDSHRGDVFRLQGRVTGVQILRPVPEVVERFELTSYYRCEFLLGDQRQPAVVFAETIPQAWKPGQTLDERAGATAMFLKLAGADAQKPTPVFVATRIAWHPPTVLGDLGMDYGLFDDLRPEESPAEKDVAKKPGAKPRRDLAALRLTSRTRECFYQMLAAARRAKPGDLIKKADQSLKQSGRPNDSVIPLFNQPDKEHGHLVVLSGTIRQAIPVRVAEEDILARFGIKQYYQMFLFTDDSQGNPLVFCVPSLPSRMPTGEDPSYAESVTVAGFFFNTWAYHSRESGKTSEQARWQLAPLLIGQEPIWHPRPAKSTNSTAAVIFGVLFALTMGAVGVSLWISRRGDRRFREQVLAQQQGLDVGLSLKRAGVKDTGPPGFHGFPQADAADRQEPGTKPEPPATPPDAPA